MASQKSARLADLIEVGAYWKYKVTLAAVGMDLFTLLARRPLDARETAAHYTGHAGAFSVFMNALAALGLLEKEGARFRNSAFAGEFLVQGKESYKGDQLIVDDACWDLWGKLQEALISGVSVLPAPLFKSNPILAQRLVMGLHRDALLLAPDMVRQVSLTEARRLLDLGGGAGTYAIAFCQRYPDLEATVFDLPNITSVAQRVVKESRMEHRIQVMEGDFLADPIPGGFDAVLMSNVLHGQGPEENEALLRKVRGSLRRGGKLIIRDVVMREDLVQPDWGAVFAVNMLLHTGRGRCYSFGEIRGWLARAGFARIREVERHALVVAS